MAAAKIGIVDDEPHIGEILKISLMDAGFQARAYTRATDLLEALDAEDFDVLLFDLMMPGVDGVELLEEMSKRPHPKRIMLMSGCSDSARKSAVRIATARGFEVIGNFAKPVDFSKVIETLSAEMDPLPVDIATLLRAIERGEIDVHYQPVFRVAGSTQPVSYVEALVRWAHPTKGTLYPRDFLPVVERHEDWITLTLYVLETAVRQLSAWRKVGFTPAVAINVPSQILDTANLPNMFDAIVEKYGINHSDLILEISEGADIAAEANGRVPLTRFKLRGYSLSIDDFGTGHSSMQRLYEVPFDQLKIDLAFVTKAHSDPQARSIVETSVELAHSLGLSVCAEGVEGVDIMNTMVDCGVDYLQGFGLCQPLPPELIEMQYNSGRGNTAA
ncbi:EAL domain-containing response regulator [Acuticoccus mangrovi]|uniref:EAL domain-containing response regulator n=1 Tax=Acuticoccus mangrovi TaxID=2796142 RepID=A0A934MD34_9HYPH|nr:EAL domain-containing response regulator [Acuticoccus mangrovi]MBJ3775917.1 EAL domain-containing response regulator [Acuticoccus mangrovi]